MRLEGIWPVYRKDREVGQCRFIRQGLYWLIDGQCVIQGGQVCRLVLVENKTVTNLGIPVPENGQLTLRRKLAIRGLRVSDSFRLELVSLDEPWEQPSMTEAPTIPEAPPTPEEPPKPQEISAPEASPENQKLNTTERTAMPITEEIPVAENPSAFAEIPEIEDVPASETLPVNEAIQTEDTHEIEETSVDEGSSATGGTLVHAELETVVSASAPVPEEVPAPAETAAAENAPVIPEPSIPDGIPYSPDRPLPPLNNWRSLRAVDDGHGGLVIRSDLAP